MVLSGDVSSDLLLSRSSGRPVSGFFSLFSLEDVSSSCAERGSRIFFSSIDSLLYRSFCNLLRVPRVFCIRSEFRACSASVGIYACVLHLFRAPCVFCIRWDLRACLHLFRAPCGPPARAEGSPRQCSRDRRPRVHRWRCASLLCLWASPAC